MTSGATYEMLWDCVYCGTKKLLGLSHRHCPKCGAPQNPEGRYFPEEADKVAVEDHVYHGVDRTCAACGQSSSRAALHCPRCGAPLEGGRDVAIKREDAAPVAAPTKAKPKKKRRGLAAAVGTLGVVGAVAGGALWTKTDALSVTSHRWRREIVIERFGPTRDSAWCDSMPREAYDVHHSREVRSHRQLPDGQACSTHKVDQGDGTYREEETCSPKTRSEPVYDDRCSYMVNRWSRAREAVAEGASSAEPLVWPSVALARAGVCIGCEREGTRGEVLTVMLRDHEGREHSCELNQERWSAMADGSEWMGKVGVVTHALDCGSLVRR